MGGDYQMTSTLIAHGFLFNGLWGAYGSIERGFQQNTRSIGLDDVDAATECCCRRTA